MLKRIFGALSALPLAAVANAIRADELLSLLLRLVEWIVVPVVAADIK